MGWLGLHAEGAKAEIAYAATKAVPDPNSTDNPEFKIVLTLIKDGLPKDPTKYTRMAKRLVGESTTCPACGSCEGCFCCIHIYETA